MITKITSFNILPFYNQRTANRTNFQNNYPKLATLQADTLSFKGMSQPSQYKTVFQYLAGNILRTNKNYSVEENYLSSQHILRCVNTLYKENKIYTDYILAKINKIKWKPYVPMDIKEYAVDKINQARISRLDEWKNFLEKPTEIEDAKLYPNLINAVSKQNPLKLVIWNAVNSELKENNRHIPVPFNAKALEQTIQDFESIPPFARKVRCVSPSFLDIYTHRLRDNLLTEKGITTENNTWIKIPSIKNDILNRDKYISELEILSSQNWCTRSSVDKAVEALEEGDFYVYYERNKNNNLWQPIIGMTTHQNKIDQIQGVENNNVIPLNRIEIVKDFINKKGLKCQSGIIDEGPKAYQQILISEKLSEKRDDIGKTFDKAIKDKDALAIFKYLNKKVSQNENGLLTIETYKPSYTADKQSGITIPLNMMGIDEDMLLKNVERINGDCFLDNKNSLYSSSITQFPENLKEVTGKFVCSKDFFDKYKEQILNVVSNHNKIIIHN